MISPQYFKEILTIINVIKLKIASIPGSINLNVNSSI